MRPTVLLTGGFGNLGGRIAASLHKEDKWHLRLASRTHKSPPSWAPTATVIHLDLLNPTEIDAACKGVDAVIHLAALNDRDAERDPQLAEELSGTGTMLLTEASTRYGVGRFIFMSTAHVYGSPLQGTITEKSPTTNDHPYSTSHLSGEREVSVRHQHEDFLGVVLRCANGFGAPMDSTVDIWHILVNDLCRQATTRGSLTLRSSGQQQRNFIPIEDICTALSHFLKLDKEKVGDGIFNLGSASSHSVLEMALTIASRCRAVLGIDPPIIRPPSTIEENHTPLDYRIDKLLHTGFTPANDINNELDRLLMVCRDQFR